MMVLALVTVTVDGGSEDVESVWLRNWKSRKCISMEYSDQRSRFPTGVVARNWFSGRVRRRRGGRGRFNKGKK